MSDWLHRLTETKLCPNCNNSMQAVHVSELHKYRHWTCRWDGTRIFWGKVFNSEEEWQIECRGEEGYKKFLKDEKKRKYFESKGYI